MLSNNHILLVSYLEEWISSKVDLSSTVLVSDNVKCIGAPSMPKIAGFRPDCIAIAMNGDYLYIGEAKTENDLQNDHSLRQIESYLIRLKEQGKGIFVLAVPWGCEGTATDLVRYLAERSSTSMVAWEVVSNRP